MSKYILAFTKDFVQSNYRPSLFKYSGCTQPKSCECKSTTGSQNNNFCIPYSFSPTNYCKTLENVSRKSPSRVQKCPEEQKGKDISPLEIFSSSDKITSTTYREHFKSPEKKSEEENLKHSCSDSYARLKQKPKLAIWELDEKTLKRLYRKSPKEIAGSEQNRQIPLWKSEYDDVYNRTGQAIIRSHKIEQYRRKKALKKKVKKL